MTEFRRVAGCHAYALTQSGLKHDLVAFVPAQTAHGQGTQLGQAYRLRIKNRTSEKARMSCSYVLQEFEAYSSEKLRMRKMVLSGLWLAKGFR